MNDREINAFALPGGPVYINRGVIEAADNEAQLAGVIAHEVSHVALRHGTNQASKASAAQLPLAILGGIARQRLHQRRSGGVRAPTSHVNSVLLKYSRTAESQADLMGAQILYDSGYDPRAMAQFFQKIEAQQEGSGPVEFFSNHPSPDHRIENVNQEVNALGGVRRDFNTNSREFDDIKRYLQSLPAAPGQQSLTSGQSGANQLLIVSASYGAGNRFIDVRQRMQSLVQNDRLALEVTNSSMGGDPISQSKTLQMRYQWDNRSYDVTIGEHQQLSIPTRQQISDSNDRNTGNGSSSDTQLERFVRAENSLMSIDHPASWQTYGQGDAMTITPRDGLVADSNGNRALAYGVIVNIFEPRADIYSRQLQGSRNEQASGRDSAVLLEQSTNQLVQELRLANRNMRVIRYGEAIRVDGAQGLSTYSRMIRLLAVARPIGWSRWSAPAA